MFQKKRVSLILPEAYPSGSSQFITSHTFPTGEKNEDPGNELFFDSICLIVTYVFARLNFHDFQNISCVPTRSGYRIERDLRRSVTSIIPLIDRFP